MPEKRSGWLFGLIAAGIVAALVRAERRRALRTRVEETGERAVRNLAIAGLTAATTQVTMAPVVQPLTRWVERRRIGLVQRLPISQWLRDALAVVLLDYTLYWWHVLEHRLAWLYRFHQVHHA